MLLLSPETNPRYHCVQYVYCGVLNNNNVRLKRTHFMDDVMRQPGQDSERVPKVGDDVHDVLHHRGREAGLHRHGLHPLGEVVRHRQDVLVSVERLGQRPSDVQAEPLPRLRHLPSRG